LQWCGCGWLILPKIKGRQHRRRAAVSRGEPRRINSRDISLLERKAACSVSSVALRYAALRCATLRYAALRCATLR